MSNPSTHWSIALAAMLCGGWLGPSPTIAQPNVDDADIVNASKELRRVLYEREELRGQLRELERETDQIIARLKTVDEIVAHQKQLDDLWSQIDKAKKEGDKQLFESLEHQAEQLELTIEHRRDMAEIDGELRELAPLVAYLREINQNDYAEPVARLVKSLQEFRQVSVQLHQIYLKGPESAEAPLEERSEQLHEEIEVGRDLVGLLRELRQAYEEEEYKRIEELEREIQELQRDEEAAPDVDDQTAGDATREPILITEAALARVAQSDFRDVVPLLQTYCFDCHGKETQSGELNIQAMISERPIVKNRDQWINVLEQAKNRVMPPEDGTQPSEQERIKLVLTLHNALHNFDYSGIVDPGYEMARRLTHDEFDNTIRDLFGVDVRPAGKFPTDLVGTSGFDNSANSLFIQPLLMERYLGAAEEVVTAALPRQPQTEAQRRARALIFVQEPSAEVDDVAAAQAVLRRYLLRAYRRPPTEEELARCIHQFQMARRQGLDFFDATKVVISTSLISPNFVLKSESEQDTREAYRVTDWELASRLSYFLWASMPDTELFDLAGQGKLHDPKVLRAQIERMIMDPKSNTLGTIFIAQWLGSQHLGTRMRLDPIDNPWCTETLMTAMRDETAMFFHTLVKDNHPIQRLVDADFTFLNEELAKHYRISGVVGEQMQRVSLKTDRRGGIFGQGSLLAVTSFPYRTSPVVRGRWILGDVLGTPPPPPPPNVSELPEEIEEEERLTFRQKLELHRRAPNCYACHSQMDPLGFSLENYDWFGRWRSKIRRRTVDARGALPDGTQFEGLTGLRKVIIEQRLEDLARQITSKMLSYALGRQLEYYDVPAVRKIVAAVKKDDYRFHTLVREVVMSYPFQYKKKRAL